MDLDLIGVTAASISVIRQCGPDRAVDRPRGIRAATHKQTGEDYAGAEHPVPLEVPTQMGGRRNIGCGWWPIGSDADRERAYEGLRLGGRAGEMSGAAFQSVISSPNGSQFAPLNVASCIWRIGL